VTAHYSQSMHLNRIFLFCLFFLFSFEALTQQKYLVLDKPGRVKRIRFYVGDEISFRLTGDRMVITDQITAVTDTSIVIRNTHVPIREISAIIIRYDNNLLNQAIYFLPRAGIVFFLADTINPLLNWGELRVSRWGVTVGGSMVASSFVLRAFRTRTYRINDSRRLRTLETF
jgi:hypothetical protein